MGQIPHYVHMRKGQKFGPTTLIDGMQKDGLVDAYDGNAMGVCADATAAKFEISREAQDEFAINSYKKVAEATEKGIFAAEIVPVEIKGRKGTV